jgi:hypothetical protein
MVSGSKTPLLRVDTNQAYTEFGCQHARWLMRSRWDNKGGPLPPCSVYLRHCQRRNLSVYFISGSAQDSCIATLQQQLGYKEGSRPQQFTRQRQKRAAECPFYVHALILGESFEQSKEYVSNVRKRLMDEVCKCSV